MSVPRERAPGFLGWTPASDMEMWLLSEALHYRRALIKVEAVDRVVPSTEQSIARRALDDGEDRAIKEERKEEGG